MFILISHLSLGHQDMVCTKIVYKTNYPGTSLYISSISFMISQDKAARFLFLFQKKGNFVEKSLGFLPIFNQRFCPLLSLRVGENDQKVTMLDFCFTNLHICKLLEKDKDYFGKGLYFLMFSRLSLGLFYFNIWQENFL